MRFQSVAVPSCAAILSVIVPLIGCSKRESTEMAVSESDHKTAAPPERQLLEVGEKARRNLDLVVKVARPTEYWRTITIPGTVADRPGVSDRGVTSPAVGVVSEIHAFPGDLVKPGQRLVTLRLFSEYLQATQTQLFKATQEAKLIREQIERLGIAANSGAVSGARLIEQRNELQRQQTWIQASRYELLNRGLTPEQIELVSEGNYVSTIDVLAPPPPSSELAMDEMAVPSQQNPELHAANATGYEVHSLGVELGKTVQAGEVLANLANHHVLYVIGHAFKRESGLLAQAAQNKVSLRVEFAEDADDQWPANEQRFQIRHLSNTMDPATRTFDFFVPFANQARTYEKDGRTFLVWRYRPGQRARIEVPVERFSNVFVVPSEAVAREGAEAYVYRQNGDLFNQIPVHILHEDRTHVVLASDQSITPGTYLAQNAAASLRRIQKAQSASGAQPGLHVHADGTVHAAH